MSERETDRMPTGPASSIRTPDQRVRVFVSSTLRELAPERAAVRDAITRLRLAPVMFELGARPHPPQALYRSYLAQSDVFVGLYWQSYGWVAPGTSISGLEDEYQLSDGKPRLLYVKDPAPDREPRLEQLLERIVREGAGCYRRFSSVDELGELLSDDLALVLSERFLAEDQPAASIDAGAGAGADPLATCLPIPVTPLIGRDAQVRQLQMVLDDEAVRLVTLTGSGGIGKTRLAMACAQQLAGSFPGAVHVVCLAAVRDPGLVAPAIAAAVGAPVEHRQPPLAAAAERLRDERALLVLDNVEQVLGATTDILSLLSACPRLTVLVTSRVALRVRGEHLLAVPPLDLPPPGATDSLDRLVAVPATRLFVERAQAIRPDLALDGEEAAAVGEICRRLEGIPLAIEIAAARVGLLQPTELLERLGRRLDLLTGGPTDLPARQQTLRATIDWSFGLLDPATAQDLVRMAVFVDGWTLEAASRVCERDELAMLDLLEIAVAHNLVVVNRHGEDGPRFRTLETIREYLLELLERTVDVRRVRERHVDHYCDLVHQAEAPLRGVGQSAWAARLEMDHGNIRAAVRWLLDQAEATRCTDLMWGAVLAWWLNGRVAEVRPWIDELMEGIDTAPASTAAKLLTTAAVVALELGDDETVAASTERALEMLSDVDEPLVAAVARLFQAYVLPSHGSLVGARRHLEGALDAFRHLDAPFFTGLAITSIGGFLCVAGDTRRARQHQEEAIVLGRRIENERLVAQATTELAWVALAENRPEDARNLLGDSATAFLQSQSSEGLAFTLSAYARLALLEGDPERGVLALGAADALRERVRLSVWPSYRDAERRLARELRQAAGEHRDAEVRRQAAEMSVEEVICRVQQPPNAGSSEDVGAGSGGPGADAPAPC